MVAKPYQILIRCPDQNLPAKSVAVEVFPTAEFTLRDLVVSAFPGSGKNLRRLSFNLNGKLIDGASRISEIKMAPVSTLNLTCRLLGGGGGDGVKWLNCSLSNKPLKRPVVVDLLGNLFDKEALLDALVEEKVPEEFRHIKRSKDMVNVKMESGANYQCPISGLEFNGKHRFFALISCGHVLSAKALEEVKSEESECPVCGKEFAEADKIVINGNDEEVAILREGLEEQRERLKNMPRLSGTKHVMDGEAIIAYLFPSSSKKSNLCRSLPLDRN